MTFNNYWGPATWYFLHTIANKVKEEHFNEIRIELLDVFRNICFVLPCPDCQEHAKKFVNTHNFHLIKTKNDFILMLWSFHNSVNKRKLRKGPIFSQSSLVMYDNAVFIKIFNNFAEKFTKPIHSQRLLMDSMGRTTVVNKIQNFIKNNITKFNL